MWLELMPFLVLKLTEKVKNLKYKDPRGQLSYRVNRVILTISH